MRAVHVNAYGPPEVLEPGEAAAPTAGAGEVVIDVEYAGVNFAEVMFRRGQFEIGVPHVPGLEAAGTVREVGAEVTGLAPGQRVAALTLAGGGYAERVVAPAALTVPLDDSVPSDLGAAFPCNVTVALGLLRDAARLQDGESVLVTGPAGGVGTAAAQIARRMGASAVYGVTSSADKAAYASDFGYDHVFTYDDLVGQVAERTGGTGVDVLLDAVGGPVRREAMDLLALFGRHIVFGDAAREDAEFTGVGLWSSSRSVGGYNLGAMVGARPDLARRRLLEAAGLVSEGAVRIDVTAFPLAEAVKAHELLETRRSTGKYVLSTR
ncbi:quinone oxidoreductase family protein [Nocardiopsis aegyptia]|uniref:NADPH2:quinone reductase n=1 Tax=Nocardiopsis aegyptia TaxID=220378 RepID=A0A7Z0JAX6_9ACTN|nr:zinc-binding dehydrogenase [Nocardiopsis aegyptia]NYJ35596.1 NADPH2:quinone reductase [Nocardiopsis aegyptia]